VFVKPYCLISGSFPNLLVYLPRAQGVKKARGKGIGRGKVIHPIPVCYCHSFESHIGSLLPTRFCFFFHALYSETRCQSVGSENRVYRKHEPHKKNVELALVKVLHESQL
jgi:hypothetical protein